MLNPSPIPCLQNFQGLSLRSVSGNLLESRILNPRNHTSGPGCSKAGSHLSGELFLSFKLFSNWCTVHQCCAELDILSTAAATPVSPRFTLVCPIFHGQVEMEKFPSHYSSIHRPLEISLPCASNYSLMVCISKYRDVVKGYCSSIHMCKSLSRSCS